MNPIKLARKYAAKLERLDTVLFRIIQLGVADEVSVVVKWIDTGKVNGQDATFWELKQYLKVLPK